MPKAKVESPLRRGGKTHDVGAEIELDQAVIDGLPAGVVAAAVVAGPDELVALIAELDAGEPVSADWTKSSGPTCAALSRLIGEEISTERRDAAWAVYRAQQAGEEAAESVAAGVAS